MYRQPAVEPRSGRKTDHPANASEQPRHEWSADEADAWTNRTAVPFVAMWKRAVARAEAQLLRTAGWFVLLDLGAALSACFIPFVSPLLGFARLGLLVVLVPAVLRTLAIANAERDDAALLKAITVVIGVAALYFVVRTGLVVGVCAL